MTDRRQLRLRMLVEGIEIGNCVFPEDRIALGALDIVRAVISLLSQILQLTFGHKTQSVPATRPHDLRHDLMGKGRCFLMEIGRFDKRLKSQLSQFTPYRSLRSAHNTVRLVDQPVQDAFDLLLERIPLGRGQAEIIDLFLDGVHHEIPPPAN